MIERHPAGFIYQHGIEPHFPRRREILRQHPDVVELFGFDRTTIAITIVVTVAQLAAAAMLAKLGVGWATTLVLAWTLGAIASHWSGQAIHETAHNLAARTRLANRALAWFANLSMVFPIAETFHRYHLAHHKYLGVVERDTDLPLGWEARVIANRPVLKAVWLLLYFFFYVARGLTFVKRPTRGEVLQFALMIAVDVALARFLGAHALVYLAVSTIAGHSLHPVAAHFIHEHYTFAEGQETNSYYGPLNGVTFNVGYHVEHHDFMSIPGSRLPRLHALASHHYDGLRSHRSWTWVLWHFISSRGVSVQGRVVRTLDDFRAGLASSRR